MRSRHCNRGSSERVPSCFAGHVPLYTSALRRDYLRVLRITPGDKAELATDGHNVIAFLTDGLQTCVRFLVPDFLVQMIKQVEGGKSSHSGKGT